MARIMPGCECFTALTDRIITLRSVISTVLPEGRSSFISFSLFIYASLVKK